MATQEAKYCMYIQDPCVHGRRKQNLVTMLSTHVLVQRTHCCGDCPRIAARLAAFTCFRTHVYRDLVILGLALEHTQRYMATRRAWLVNRMNRCIVLCLAIGGRNALTIARGIRILLRSRTYARTATVGMNRTVERIAAVKSTLRTSNCSQPISFTCRL